MAETKRVPTPSSRRLRIFSFDPGLATQYDMSGISEITIKVPWEELEQGPIGEYVEVIDLDPASGALLPARRPRPIRSSWRRTAWPVGVEPAVPPADGLRGRDDDDPPLRARARPRGAVGLAPGRPTRPGSASSSCGGCGSIRMRCVTGMRTTARRRRRCCSATSRSRSRTPTTRRARWSSPACRTTSSRTKPRMRCSTACTRASTSRRMPTSSRSTRRSPTSSRCSSISPIPASCETRSRARRGSFASENLLGQLAQQFGRATGRRGALRDALGRIDETSGKWKPLPPDPTPRIDQRPHARGAILVAAVFGAFTKVYRSRTADLFRIATEGTGRAARGRHPSRPRRRARRGGGACRDRSPEMCIRAIDYCPPVDITFGDFLRAIMTADHDLNPEDNSATASPSSRASASGGSIRAVSAACRPDGLMWPTGDDAMKDARVRMGRDDMEKLFTLDYASDGSKEGATRQRGGADGSSSSHGTSKAIASKRGRASTTTRRRCGRGWSRERDESWRPRRASCSSRSGLPKTVFMSRSDPSRVAVEVHSVRTALRRTAKRLDGHRSRGRDHAAPARVLRQGRAGGARTDRGTTQSDAVATSAIAPAARC